jgi:hypothetical protein
MKDWFSEVIMNLPQKDEPDNFIQVSKDCKDLVFMNFERTIGLTAKTLRSTQYLENCEEMTWDEFRKQNVKNAISGKCFYQNKYIKQIAAILQALNFSKSAITVFFPKIQSPIMFAIDGSEVGLLLAPCRARDVASLVPKTIQSDQK